MTSPMHQMDCVLRFAEIRRFTPSQPGQNRHLIGGLISPPYKDVWFSYAKR